MGYNISDSGITIDGNTKLVIKTGNEAYGKILTSDSSGLVDWQSAKSLFGCGHYIGELYGGGIVVSVWKEGDDEKVLIAALSDVVCDQPGFGGIIALTSPNWSWGAASTTLIGTSSNSNYDGNLNTLSIRSQAVSLGTTYSSANFYYPSGGYTDWYLPSYYELNAIFENALVINKVLGDRSITMGSIYGSSAIYWSSTEVNATNAWALDLSEIGTFVSKPKNTPAYIRPVRMERNFVGNGVIMNLDASSKKSYSDSTLSDRWVDLVNYGLTSSYSLTFSSINSTGPTYSATQSGYFNFNGSSYVDFIAPVGTSKTITIEMWAKVSSSGYSNKIIFGWLGYYIQFLNGNLGFVTFTTDCYGISASTVSSLGLLDKWNHYVFEMRNDVSYTNNKIYINGNLMSLSQLSGAEFSGNRTFGIVGSDGKGRIGGSRLNTTSLITMDCSLIRMYNRSLYASEVLENYNKSKRKYEINISNTHTLSTGTVSITQNLYLDIPGKKNDKILRSSLNGTASWVEKNYLFTRPVNEKQIGELFGGGIIVAKWNYPTNIYNYLIMSKSDVSLGASWSNIISSSVPTNDFDGATNSNNIINQVSHLNSAAKLCDTYTSDVFSDWYLPSIFELNQAFSNSNVIGNVMGDDNLSGKYWSSTEFSATSSYSFELNVSTSVDGSGVQKIESKSTVNKVRAFRQFSSASSRPIWVEPDPWAEPTYPWYTDPWHPTNWNTYNGIVTRNLLFHFNTNNLNSYNGYSSTGKDLITGSAGSLLTGVTYSSSEKALLINGTYSLTVFTTDSYVDFGNRISTLNLTFPFSIEAWVKPTYGTESNNLGRGIFCSDARQTYLTNYYGTQLALSANDGTDTYNLNTDFGNGLGNGGSYRKSAGTTTRPIKRNVWNHIAVNIISTTSFEIYVNGVLQTIFTSGTATTLGWSSGQGTTSIGRGMGGYRYIFGGYISVVRFYNTQLSASEVSQNFQFDRYKYGL